MQDYGYETEMYYEREPAAAAVDRLHRIGYGADDISVMMSDKTREKAFGAMVNAKGSEGIAAGATIGGVITAIVAGLAGTGLIVGTAGAATPLVAGPLAAALAGLGAGALGGGIIGGLIGVGVAEKKAKDYEKGLREGGILVAVRPKTKDDRDAVQRAMHDKTRTTTTGEVVSNRDEDVDYAGETKTL